MKFTSASVLFLFFLCPAIASSADGATLGGGNDSQEIRVLKSLAEQGDLKAQNSLGISYYNGVGVSEDHAVAV